jgi:hypothetical protein
VTGVNGSIFGPAFTVAAAAFVVRKQLSGAVS